MRYEVVRLLQFVFSMCLVLGAFGGGLLLGWHRWGRERRFRASAAVSASPTGPTIGHEAHVAPGAMCVHCGSGGRSDLFAPEIDDDDELIDLIEHEPDIRGELPSGAWTRG